MAALFLKNKIKFKKMKNIKAGIFYHRNQKPVNRKYWVGTFTEDGTACEELIKTIAGRGKPALQKAKLFLNNL